MKIIIIVGLPGSGKTHLAKRLSQEIPSIVVDDLINPQKIWDAIDVAEQKGINQIILSDPYFCLPNIQKDLTEIFKNYNLEWIYFENNLAKCQKNVKYRESLDDNRNVDITLKYLSKQYLIPISAKIIEIWEPPITFNFIN